MVVSVLATISFETRYKTMNTKHKTDLLQLNFDKPAPFSNHLLIKIEDYLAEEGIFLKPSSIGISIKSVDLNNVIGQAQGYDSFSWGEALNGYNCKRMKKNINELNRNPNYYYDDLIEHEHLSLVNVGGKYFIETGKHRIVIARFFYHFNNTPPILKNATIEHRELDHEFMRLYSIVQELKATQNPKTTHYNIDVFYTEIPNEPCLRMIKGHDVKWYTRQESFKVINQLKQQPGNILANLFQFFGLR